MNRIRPVPLVVLALACALPCHAQTGPVGVRDQAKLFSADAIRQAEQTLQQVRDQSGWQVAIQTIKSLDGQDIKQRAVANAKKAQVRGLYVLISKDDHKFQIMPSNSARRAFPQETINQLIESMTAAFKQGKFDQGLLDTVARIKTEAAASPAPAAPAAADREQPGAVPVPPPVPAGKKNGFPRIGNLGMPEILILGVGALALLWVLSKVLRRPQPQEPPPGPGYAPVNAPVPPVGARPNYPPGPPGYGPSGRPGVPAGGPGYGPQPGYGPGYPPQGGYGPPPQQGGGGGGFMSGMLGGLGGAVVGNILYDQFGRPHPAPSHGGDVPHVEHGTSGVPVPPPPGYPESNEPLPPPPTETYDPNAGGGGDWGEPAAPEPSTGGDWADTAAPADTGGDWGDAGGGDTGGDWGDGGGGDTGGDWGGDAGGDTGDDGGGGGEW